MLSARNCSRDLPQRSIVASLLRVNFTKRACPDECVAGRLTRAPLAGSRRPSVPCHPRPYRA